METSINLLRDSIHPQGVGRRVPGGSAATRTLAALRGAHSSPIYEICLGRCADQRLGWRSFASLVEWPCKAPCALLSSRSLQSIEVSI
jgi:hypothetical protein